MSSCSLGWLFTLLLPLLCRSFAISCNHIYLVFALFPDLLGCFSEILCSYLYLKVFSSNNFRVSYLTLRPLIHSELIFLCRVKDTDQVSFFLKRISRFPSTTFFFFFFEETAFSPIYIFGVLINNQAGQGYMSTFLHLLLISIFCQLHAAYIFMVRQYDLRVLTSQAMFLLFEIVLTTWNLLWFYVNFKILKFLLLWRIYFNLNEYYIQYLYTFGSTILFCPNVGHIGFSHPSVFLKIFL